MSWDTASSGARDWYAMLGVTRKAPDDEIATAIERLSRQAASLANVAPERSQNLRETVRSMKRDLQSGPEARSRYLEILDRPAVPIPTSLTSSPVPTPTPAATVPQTETPSASSAPTYGLASVVPPALLPAAKRFKQFIQSGWTCSTCGASSMPGEKFCSKCGAVMLTKSAPSDEIPKAAPFCEACGTKFKSTDRFCNSCGAARG